MSKRQRIRATVHQAGQGAPTTSAPCPNCPTPVTVADNTTGNLISVNVGGHATAAHRGLPGTPGYRPDNPRR